MNLHSAAHVALKLLAKREHPSGAQAKMALIAYAGKQIAKVGDGPVDDPLDLFDRLVQVSFLEYDPNKRIPEGFPWKQFAEAVGKL